MARAACYAHLVIMQLCVLHYAFVTLETTTEPCNRAFYILFYSNASVGAITNYLLAQV